MRVHCIYLRRGVKVESTTRLPIVVVEGMVRPNVGGVSANDVNLIMSRCSTCCIDGLSRSSAFAHSDWRVNRYVEVQTRARCAW